MTKSIAMIIYPDVQLLDVIGPMEVLAAARDGDGQPFYKVELAGPVAGPVRGSSGLEVMASRAWGDLDGDIDTLLVAGGEGSRKIAGNPELCAQLQRLAPLVARYGSVCTGAYPLAAAGLLDGKTITTHWAWAKRLAQTYPAIKVEADAIYRRDGRVITSAGVTAGMDLALSLVEEDLGHAMAMQIARHFVMYMKRPGGQAQFSANLRAQINGTGPIGDICDFILKNLDQDLSVPTLADRAAMSPRHFYRRFSAEMDMAPAAFVAAARLELARELLETSALAIEIVARRAGFSSAEQLRRALSRRMGATPRIYRSRFSTPDHNPPHFPQQRTQQS